jgi:protein-tyrosine phosphatase
MPMDLFDLHAHILPGVDDGPVDLDETVETLRAAWEGGTRSVVATSHMYLEPLHTPLERVREVFERTTEELARRAGEREEWSFLSEMRLWLGAENYLSTELIQALERDQVLPLGGGGCLLIEFNPYLSFEIMKSALKRVLATGYTPVLAHVERYRIFQRDPGRLAEAVAMGCHAQVNAESLLGPFTSPTRRRSVDFLKSGAVTLVASDMHNADRRRSRLGEAAEALERRFSAARVQEWLADNPRSVVDTARRTS